ncbi:MAG TPA: M28 family peptidase [Anaeromyxobacter sp.]
MSPRRALLPTALLLAACSGGRPPPDAVTACRAAPVDPVALRSDVEALVTGFGARDFDHPENLERAAAFVADALRTTGAKVTEQTYRAADRTYRNVLAELGPDTPERIVVGAHYDTAGDQPGADDDASGVAGLLALARLLRASPPPLKIVLAAYVNEEPPSFGTERMGSAVHARALANRGVRVRLMISLEMIGTFSDAKGSQAYPAVLGWFHPSTGNFVAVVGKWGQGGAVRGVAAGMRAGSPLPVETLSAPTFLPGVDFSDHRSFWGNGYEAVMVTDTAFFRNPRYHTAEDRPDTLDYARMAEVVKGVCCAVQAAARR